MASPNAFYTLQPAFTGGEISSDVASRIDLDKYQVALLQAKNAIVRPYGAVRKRSGFLYCGPCKYHDKRTILVKLISPRQFHTCWNSVMNISASGATAYTLV